MIMSLSLADKTAMCVCGPGSDPGKASSGWCESTWHYSTHLGEGADADGHQGS